jgi:hypothetical protein
MHHTMMLRILERMTADQIAGRIMDERLPQSERDAAFAEFKRRGLMPKTRPHQRAWNRA